MDADAILTRRRMLGCGCGLAAVGAVSGCSSEPVLGPEKPIASLNELKVDVPIAFTYPDDELAYLIDLGKRVEGGVGYRKSIVAYSGLCQHMGIPVEYQAASKHFVCSAHFSEFDPLNDGNTVEGPSPSRLPRILLKIVQRKVYAIGVQGGVIYGRALNHKS